MSGIANGVDHAVVRVQFLLERPCAEGTWSDDIGEPFPVWVEWPSVDMGNHSRYFCGSHVHYKVVEDGVAIRKRLGLPAPDKVYWVCEHMGRVIE